MVILTLIILAIVVGIMSTKSFNYTSKITLATLDQVTEQEVFEQISRHLLYQNKKSLNDYIKNDLLRYNACAYRGRDNTKCAVGCIIGDNEYKKDFEGQSWNGLLSVLGIKTAHWNIIDELQQIHDSVKVVNWKYKLIELGKSFELDTQFIEKEF